MMELIERQDVAINCDLVQVTPMLHFQHSEPEATLRPSEVKPKLDRYICHLLEKYIKEIPSTWFKKDNAGRKSLRYGMRIVADKTICGAKIKEENPSVYSDITEKYLKWVKSDKNKITWCEKTKLSIHTKNIVIKDESLCEEIVRSAGECPVCLALNSKDCQGHTLKGTIEALLPFFFVTHTFGSRQSKGYGSFRVDGKEPTGEALAKLLPPDTAGFTSFTVKSPQCFDISSKELSESFFCFLKRKYKQRYKTARVFIGSPIISRDYAKEPHRRTRRQSALRFHFVNDNKGYLFFFNIPIEEIKTDRDRPINGAVNRVSDIFDICGEATEWQKKYCVDDGDAQRIEAKNRRGECVWNEENNYEIQTVIRNER